MRLFHSPTSPYARKVMIALHETGQLADVNIVSASGTPLDSSNMPVDLAPLGKLPVLALEDGAALYDSRVICQYLAKRVPSTLYPDAPRLWDTLTIEATADGIMDAAIAIVYETRLRPENQVNKDLINGQWDKIARSIKVLESRWLPNLSSTPDMGHFAVAVALDYVDFRLTDRDWRTSSPALANWLTDIAHRPSLQATLPTG
ncbi:glutathione S-transferase [Pseudoruegeria sp. SK021]|uniref:glutathione S-transferase n=1 Tax=Pseudoruegeria sp. SK021 TaxID=1933035 RepID=UPI000A2508A4|nr:glutathione S-transferase [Pseudoruegeria sp. SK021]OSP56777.1 glutathione S-transferase [Pseudoruegeria sp. SK021]